MTLTDAERHVICHSLGIDSPRKRGQKPYRNHFCTGPETDDWPVLMALVGKGMMFESRPPSDMSGGDHVFSVTQKGKEAVGCRA